MKTFAEKLKELHPDFNGGDASRVAEFTALMKQRRLEARSVCRCGCARLLSKLQVKRGQSFASRLCYVRARFYSGGTAELVLKNL